MIIQKSQEMTLLMNHAPHHISKPHINTYINTNDSSGVGEGGQKEGVTIFQLVIQLLENSC